MRRATSLLIFMLAVHAVAQAQNPREFIQKVVEANLRGANPPEDVTISGELIDAAGRAQSIRISVKGRDKVRYEIGVGVDQRTTVFNAGVGWTVSDGRLQPLETHTATRRPTVFPLLDLIGPIGNPASQVIDRGVGSVGGRAARLISLRLNDGLSEKRLFRRGLDEQVDFFIDPNTMLIVRTERMRQADNDMDSRFSSILEFSDYRQVNQMWVPFRIVNTIGISSGNARSTLVVQTVEFNRGLTDAQFSLPEVRRD